MIHAGDVIENPVTGERLIFLKASRETSDEAVVLETVVKSDGFVAADLEVRCGHADRAPGG